MENKIQQTTLKKNIQNIFDSIINKYKEIIIHKIILKNLYCFNDNKGFFIYIDKDNKNYITLNDIRTFLNKNDIKYTSEQLKLIMKFYDKDGDDCWNYDEYLSFINDDISLNNLKELKIQINEAKPTNNQYTRNSLINYEKELVVLFKIILSFIKFLGIKVQNLRNYLMQINISLKEFFNLISQSKPFVDPVQLLNFLIDDIYKISQIECEILIKIISEGGNRFSLKNLEKFFKYDKFLEINETEFVRPIGYYGVNIIDQSKTLYYNIFKKLDRKPNINNINNINNKENITKITQEDENNTLMGSQFTFCHK